MRLVFCLVLSLIANITQAFDIIAHRGASGYLPEHTLPAATLAFMQGADYIEQDIVVSKDNHLIVLHDIHLETVTNVEQIFPKRKRQDGRYYVIDFTLAELRMLNVHEREDSQGRQVYPLRYNGKGRFRIATFEEQIAQIQSLNKTFDKNVGFYPEIKSPEFHLQEQKDITQLVIESIKQYNLDGADKKLIVQSFYPPALKRIRETLGKNITLVQLIAENSWEESSIDYETLSSPNGIKQISLFVDGIGPWIPHIMNEDGTSTKLLSLAKEYGLFVHPYTFRLDDPVYDLPPRHLYEQLQKLGINGIFTDQVTPFMRNFRQVTEGN